MRIIKLSPNDPAMANRNMVDSFFNKELQKRNPTGQFFITKGRISKKGISPGEMLVFSYNGEIVYLALSQSERLNTDPEQLNANGTNPFYFIVETATIKKGKGNLKQLEDELMTRKNIIRTQGWPTIKDSPEIRKIWDQFKEK